MPRSSANRRTVLVAGPRLVMIAAAAERAGVHPQTLRVYEARGLIRPTRSEGNTRLYSDVEIARLRRICELTSAGVNLAGVARILTLEEELERLRGRLRAG